MRTRRQGINKQKSYHLMEKRISLKSKQVCYKVTHLFLFSSSHCWTIVTPDDRAHTLGFIIKPRQSRRIGKQTITDLSFANDLALLSDIMEQAQEILLALETQAANISTKKTQYMSFNQTSNEPLHTKNGSKLQQVQDLKYLGDWTVSTIQDMHGRKGQV